MAGKLFVIGVGPGDPELLTLKAANILNTVECIFVPKGREEGASLALSIVQGAISINGKEIVEAYFPMQKTKNFLQRGDESNDELLEKWSATVQAVVNRLNKGIDVAFITIGDPSIYSTFYYLYDGIMRQLPSLEIEIIPGISSINAAAARVKFPLGLGSERIAILPANYMEDLEQTLNDFDTVVLMKINKVYEDLLRVLDELNLKGNAVVVSRAFMDDETVIADLDKLDRRNLGYFSLMIVRK